MRRWLNEIATRILLGPFVLFILIALKKLDEEERL